MSSVGGSPMAATLSTPPIRGVSWAAAGAPRPSATSKVARPSAFTRMRNSPDRSGSRQLDEQRQGFLDQVGQRAEELGAPGTVQRAVIARERQHHGRLN